MVMLLLIGPGKLDCPTDESLQRIYM